MNESQRPLGSFGVWLVARLIQLFVFTWWLAALRKWDLYDLLFLLIFAQGCYFFDKFAHGFADDKGIYFRRYLKLNFVPWESVHSVVWKPRTLASLSVLLKVGPSWRRQLEFSLNPTMEELVAEFRDKKTPETISWLQHRVDPGSSSHSASSD
jgi:hypothetical protein